MEVKWACPHSGNTFDLELCDGRRVFKHPRSDTNHQPTSVMPPEPAGTAATPPAILNAAGARVIALYKQDGPQRLLMVPPNVPARQQSTQVEFAKSRKQMTDAKAKVLRAEAKHKLETKQTEATRAEHTGTVVSLFSSERS